MRITAKYGGPCSVCHKRIAPGATIEWDARARSATCVECAEDAASYMSYREYKRRADAGLIPGVRPTTNNEITVEDDDGNPIDVPSLDDEKEDEDVGF